MLRAKVLSLRATVLYGAVVFVAVVLLVRPLVAVFVGEHVVAATAARALRIIAVGFTAACVAPLVAACFHSLGRPRPSYLISIGTLLGIRIPLVVALRHAGMTGVWVALSAGEVVSALTALVVLQRLERACTRADAATAGP